MTNQLATIDQGAALDLLDGAATVGQLANRAPLFHCWQVLLDELAGSKYR